MSVSITVTIDSLQVRQAFSRLTRLMADTTPVMRAIGTGLIAGTHDRFQAGVDPGGAPWAKLNPQYAFTKRGAGILRESAMAGGLMGSIAMQAGRDNVVVGSNKIYAAVHQFGATITPKSGPHLVFKLGGRLVKARSVTIPARPYLGVSADDRQMIGDVVTASLTGAIAARRS